MKLTEIVLHMPKLQSAFVIVDRCFGSERFNAYTPSLKIATAPILFNTNHVKEVKVNLTLAPPLYSAKVVIT